MKKIYYLGNEFIKGDSLAVEMAKKFSSKFPGITFEKIDTFDKMVEQADDSFYMDCAQGVDRAVLIDDIDRFLDFRRVSAHDMDFGFFLKLNKELGAIKKAKIICLPKKIYKGIEIDLSNIFRKVITDG